MWSKKAKVIVRLQFAPYQSTFFAKAEKPLDWFEGNCYKVTDEFLDEFEKCKK